MFSCRNINTAVIFKARINIANKTFADQMLHFISTWVKSSPSIIIVKTLLEVDPTCPTELETLLADDCQNLLIFPNVSLHPDTENHESAIIPIISGTTVGVLVAMTIMVITIIGCIMLYKAKRTNSRVNL